VAVTKLAAACRNLLLRPRMAPLLSAPGKPADPRPSSALLRQKHPEKPGQILQALCLSALALPGLTLQAQADQTNNELILSPAESDEEVGLQYSHYEEGKRAIFQGTANLPNNYNPITVDSQHAFARFRPTDRTRFLFNFSEDVWSGATPWFTTPVTQNAAIYSGASYLLKSAKTLFFDTQGNPLNVALNPVMHNQAQVSGNKIQQALSYASPEIRDQTDFKVGYDWDNAALDVGGGASQERDYLSRFGNVGLRLDFNQKQTTVNMGASYTNSDTHATWNMDTWTSILQPNVTNCSNGATICGNREDAAFNLAISQVLSKNSVISSGLAYTRSSGYLSNPYKAVLAINVDPLWRQENGISPSAYSGVISGTTGGGNGSGLMAEQRPTLRNQLTWDVDYKHYVEPLNAAAKLNYSFFHDDWGINAHTFDAEWRQSLFSSWTVTPHVRYYTQTAADFYVPYVFTSDPFNANNYGANGMFSNAALVNRYFSSDQRLGGYGAISGGVAISKQFSRGVSMELGYEYYAHKSSLELGGGGTGSYTDFNYFVANAAIHANIGQMTSGHHLYSGYDLSDWVSSLFEDNPAHPQPNHAGHQHGFAAAPAGVMFAHMLDHADQFMIGYRYMRSTIGPGYQQGTNTPVDFTLGKGVQMYASGMNMDMHMLDFMYAPTDWLNLMLMPQYVDMSMMMVNNMTGTQMMQGAGGMTMPPMSVTQGSGGFGDTSGYALFKLFEGAGQHLHLTQGISAPTGAVNIRQEFFNEFTHAYLPYNMQLGSGTWDYKPSLTYTGQYDDVFWGGQVSGTHRLQQQNAYGWRLGDIFQATAWTGYQLTDWLGATVRGVYTGQGKMAGQWSDYVRGAGAYSMPDSSAANYGGSFADAGFGFTATVPHGRLAGNSFSFEWLQPVYTNFQGYQLNRTGALSATWHYAF